MHNQMKRHKKTQKGFTILVAVVTAGVLLIIAMSIGGIALKEQVLSTANKESQIAFYAADTGMECAMYGDLKNGVFTIKDDGEHADMFGGFSCGNNTIFPEGFFENPAGSNPETYSYVFKIEDIPVGDPDDNVSTCAIVKVIKSTGYTNDPKHPDPNKTYTDIYSYGYNTCEPSLTRLERGIEGHY